MNAQIANMVQVIWVSLRLWVQLICESLCIRGADSAGFILIIFLCKNNLYHFAVTSLSCSNYVSVSRRVSEYLFQLYEVLAECK